MTKTIVAMLMASALLAARPHPEMLVSTDWLAAHGNDSRVVVLHIASDRKSYDQAHIPGARFVAWSELAVARNGVPNELPPVAGLVRLLEGCGVRNNSRIVLYADNGLLFASRAFFTLDYLGLGERAALLDGGIEKWKAEKRPLSQAEPAKVQGRVKPRLRPQAVITMAELRAARQLAVIDARSHADFTGEAPNAQLTRRGHIPGASNIYWRDLLSTSAPSVFRPLAELAERTKLPPGRTAVVYCNSGVQATADYFVFRYLGKPVRLYDGALWEWSRSDAPMEP